MPLKGRFDGRSDLLVQGLGKLMGEIEAQNCGFCSGVPYCRIKAWARAETSEPVCDWECGSTRVKQRHPPIFVPAV